MPRLTTPTEAELDRMDRLYREGGLRTMASPHVLYDDPLCPHASCGHAMEWIDFKLELHRDPDGVYNPLVRAWWDGTGFVGRCPHCQGWIRFTTRRMEPIDGQEVERFLRLPDDWHTVGRFA